MPAETPEADPVKGDGEYVEIARFGDGPSPAVVTCEHGSARLPAPFRFPDEDLWIQETHWAFDPGAAELARELARELRTAAVIARFSRLLADPNRPEDSAELFRATAEGRVVRLNQSIAAAEREARLVAHRAYHRAADAVVGASTAPVVCAMHTFTPVYEGKRRTVEVGVLFDEETALAETLARALRDAGFAVELNEPYSGKLGLMYSAERHAKAHGRRPIELEVRQDLAVVPAVRDRIVRAAVTALGVP